MDAVVELSIEQKLKALYDLQTIDAKTDEIRRLKGELPMEVKDLEDELVGLVTRIQRIEADLKDTDLMIAKQRVQIKEAEGMIIKYEKQQNSVKNNREFEALAKEIEVQRIDIQLAQKRIKETELNAEQKREMLEGVKDKIAKKKTDLEIKQQELEQIIQQTLAEEQELERLSGISRERIEERLLKSYDKIRRSYRNGLAVVKVERNACGGCFNRVPAQRQLEIRQRKKIIICEQCGRILVDEEIGKSGQEVDTLPED